VLGLLSFVLISCNVTSSQSNTSLPTIDIQPFTNIPEEGIAETNSWVRINVISRLAENSAIGQTLNLEVLLILNEVLEHPPRLPPAQIKAAPVPWDNGLVVVV
jgi:hypothetical protein